MLPLRLLPAADPRLDPGQRRLRHHRPGQPDPRRSRAYRQAWTYDEVGNRKTQVDYVSGGTTTTTSTIPAPTAAHPHALSKLDYSGVGGVKTNTYTYDNAGNMITRAVAGKPSQTLGWDAEGHLATVTATGGNASYVYDVDGNRLITRDSTGATLYIGSQQLHLSPTNVVSSTRFYGANGFRSSGEGLCWTTSDRHSNSTISFKAATLAKTQRRMTPFGQSRGSAVTWPTNLGFVGGTEEPTGLTQLGARPYDAVTGRFIAADPIFTANDTQTFNGYSYAHNSPINAADPSGLKDFWLPVAQRVEQWSQGNYKYTRVSTLYVLCSTEGYCYYPYYLLLVIQTFRKYIPPAGVPYVPPAVYKAQAAIPRCPVIITPEPPPSCFILDLKCGYKNPRAWWETNGKPLVVGAAVVGLGVCAFTAGAGCAIASGAASALSMFDRTYDFVNNKEYNDGFWANAKYGGGMALDTLGFLPGLALAHGAASSGRAGSSGARGSSAWGQPNYSFVDSTNASGGRVVLSVGLIDQNDIRPFVDDAVNAGEEVHIFSGVHGNYDGTVETAGKFYKADNRAFGSMPGVQVHYMPQMSPDQITDVLTGPGVIIGGFCHSGVCLVDYM